ncbi:MAG: hypothetical protein UT34_C0001G0155 [candidate division WS6 bacterium GW2011_GWF2_39_15]|uniref:DUF1761 domain-containing protein n=1 Tax=candidate division WS6 bacterium GW2011_GWF2_39_15 TaxID=1619100 RepID=A0A0G0Q6U1_9BACT|nr:MAG: hypothetical protein UT34_C0001G0155 [candidate division WS6 bacterium GW2011_GWF2_39_15]
MEFNLLAVLLSGVGSMLLGFLWYGPLFSKIWMKESHLSEDDVKGGPGTGYLLTFIAALFMAAITSLLISRLAVTEVMDGLVIGLLIGLGYIATSFASNYIFGQKTLKLYFIDAGYQVVNVLLATIVIILMG